MKMITEKPCLAQFARERENTVVTDPSRTGPGISLWQGQSDDTNQLNAIASRKLNDAEENSSIGELSLLAAAWG